MLSFLLKASYFAAIVVSLTAILLIVASPPGYGWAGLGYIIALSGVAIVSCNSLFNRMIADAS